MSTTVNDSKRHLEINATEFDGQLDGTIKTNTTAITQSAGDNSTKVATTAYADAVLPSWVPSSNPNYLTGYTVTQSDVTAHQAALSITESQISDLQSYLTAVPSGYATESYVQTQITNLVDSAPSALNTLDELAAALGDDANFATTITTSIGTKLAKAGGTMTGDIILNDNVEVEFGTGSDVKMKYDGSNFITTVPTGSSFLIGTNGATPDDNAGKADFGIDIGSDPQISWYGDQINIGGTDMNWAGKIYENNTFNMAAWDRDLYIFTQGSSGASAKSIYLRPQAADGVTTTVAQFNGGTGTTLTGTTTINGALTVNYNGDAVNLRSTTNGQPTNLTFSTNVPDSQIGHIKYSHSNSASYGGGDSFTIGGTETTTVILADGQLMYKDGIYSKPGSGTGAGTRKDANWDTAYTHSQSTHAPTNADATPSWVPSSNPNYLTSVPAQTWASITGKPSTFTPSAHNQAWSTITSTPTTLAGYGITDAAPSSVVNQTDFVSAANGGTFNGNITLGSNSLVVSARKFTARDGNGVMLTADDATSGLTIADNGNATFTGDVTASSLDINGAADISGNITGVDTLTAQNFVGTGNYHEFGNATGSVSNNGTWHGRLNVAGSSHARIDVKDVSDGIITTMFAHTGQGAGKLGTYSNHPVHLVVNGTSRATLDSSANFAVAGELEGGSLDINGNADISGTVTVGNVITTPTDTNLSLRPNGSGHIYFGNSGNGMNFYHYSSANDGKYTTYDFNGNYYRIATTAISGVWINDPLRIEGAVDINSNVDISGHLSVDTVTASTIDTDKFAVIDSGNRFYYRTGAQVRSDIGAGTSNFDGAYGSLSGVPSTFTPSSHTHTFGSLTSKPTTLAGYGITDASTTTAMNSAISTAVANLVDSSPAALDTLNELAAAIGDDANFSTTITTSIGTKAADNAVVKLTGNQTIAGNKTFSGQVTANNSIYLEDGEGIYITGQNYPHLILSGDEPTLLSDQGSTCQLGDNVRVAGDLTVNGGDITLNGTGKITGIDTVTAATHAANKSYVDTQVATRAASSHTHTFGSITSKPTTISGYGITDALVIGTTSTTAKRGDTPTISTVQANTIIANATHAASTHAPTNATANSTDATLLARANHTGTQAYSTLTGVPTKATYDLDHLFTLVGAAADTSTNMGSYTSSTIPPNQTIKQNIDALSTRKENFIVACSDETSDLTTGTAKVTFRMPYAMQITNVRASLTTATSSGIVTVDINLNGSSIFGDGETGTLLTIDAGERTSTTAATAYGFVSSATVVTFGDDAEVSIDIDTVGTEGTGKGLKVTLIGYQR